MADFLLPKTCGLQHEVLTKIVVAGEGLGPPTRGL